LRNVSIIIRFIASNSVIDYDAQLWREYAALTVDGVLVLNRSPVKS
jgi:hypothetical protein